MPPPLVDAAGSCILTPVSDGWLCAVTLNTSCGSESAKPIMPTSREAFLWPPGSVGHRLRTSGGVFGRRGTRRGRYRCHLWHHAAHSSLGWVTFHAECAALGASCSYKEPLRHVTRPAGCALKGRAPAAAWTQTAPAVHSDV